MPFSEKALLSQLNALEDNSTIWIAYSGGMDSHVLLHMMSLLLGEQKERMKALHINHDIHRDAGKWQEHCRKVCEGLGVAMVSIKVKLPKGAGSMETRAREARYRAFERKLGADDYLFLAHHQDDQVETMLFHLMRGAGLRGLSGMPATRALGKGQLFRPLLGFSREELREYAATHKLSWIDDSSNLDLKHDRNYLRHEILPLLEKRWPGFRNNWSRTAEICAEADAILSEQAKRDFRAVNAGNLYRIDIDSLLRFPPAHCRRVLRYWLLGVAEQHALPQPDFTALQRILDEVVTAADDAMPEVSWSNQRKTLAVRRYAGHLYALTPFREPVPRKTRVWDLSQPFPLGREGGQLELIPVSENGLSLGKIKELQVRFRAGGESAKPSGRKTRPLKKLLQDYHIPPWLRDRVPLLYHNDELVAAGDLFVTEKYFRKQGRKLYRIRWNREYLRCGY